MLRARSASPWTTEWKLRSRLTLPSPKRRSMPRRSAGTLAVPPVQHTTSMSPNDRPRVRHRPVERAEDRVDPPLAPGLELLPGDALADVHRRVIEAELRGRLSGQRALAALDLLEEPECQRVLHEAEQVVHALPILGPEGPRLHVAEEGE